MIKLTLPTDSAERKEYPVTRGVLMYAPAAIAGVARISKLGNDKHNPGEELHHARGKSTDHSDCIVRHTMDVNDIEAYLKRLETRLDATDSDAVKQLLNEVSQLCWRALMWSQELHEKYGGAPLAPGARLPMAETVMPREGTVKYEVWGAGGGPVPGRNKVIHTYNGCQHASVSLYDGRCYTCGSQI